MKYQKFIFIILIICLLFSPLIGFYIGYKVIPDLLEEKHEFYIRPKTRWWVCDKCGNNNFIFYDDIVACTKCGEEFYWEPVTDDYFKVYIKK